MRAREEARRWEAYAEEDWQYALLGMGVYPRTAGWHFHQAAEKYLKAVIVQAGKEPPRTHDLLRLVQLIGVEVADAADLVEAASELSFYGVTRRYPADFPEVSDTEVQGIKGHAKVLCDFARQRLGAESPG